MLKKRIIPIELLSNKRLVKSIKFDDWRDVGDPVKASAVYNSNTADELIFLNVSRDQRDTAPLREYLRRVSEVIFMPLSVGGGIASIDDAAFMILNGADKIVLNSRAYNQPEIISETANRYGTQAVVICIDVRMGENGEPVLYSDCGRRTERVTLEEHIANVVKAGAGEIMIQSIDRDGMMQGFDIDLINRVMRAAPVPVIAAGGSGAIDHLREAFLKTDVAAIACGSLFNFSDTNPLRAKAFLSNHGLPFKVV